MNRSSMHRPARSWALVYSLLLAALVAASMVVAKPAHATDFTVTNTNDSGAGSLRQAILNANAASGADTIRFDISGSGVKTISPTSPLPDITDTVTIDGYTQLGSSPNTLSVGTNAVPLVELNGQNAGQAIGLRIKTSDSVVRGLAINRFSGAGISIEGGVQATGVRAEGNFIGTDPGGTQDLGNGLGVFYNGTSSTIGGTSPEARNLISGNGQAGILLGQIATSSKIEGNLIGTSKDGTSPLGNSSDGVAIGAGGRSTGPNNVVGGESTGAANTIAFNERDGVSIAGCFVTPGTGERVCGTGNGVFSNSIFSNGLLGIDLNVDGPTANDPGDVDDFNDGSNLLQNFPEITSAAFVGNRVTVEGTLNSAPSGKHKKRFTIQFFSSPQADPSGFGEGRAFVGRETVTTDRRGDRSFSFTFAPVQPISPGEEITATATDTKGNTSEFSAAQQVSV